MNRLIIWCKYYKLFYYIFDSYLKYAKQNECVLQSNQFIEFDYLQNNIASCHKNNEEESTLVIDLV